MISSVCCDEPEAWIQRLNVDYQANRSSHSNFSCRCLWGNCTEVFPTINDLKVHLHSHFVSLPRLSTGHGHEFVCPVRRCELSLPSAENLLRHAYMHFFHALRQQSGLEAILTRPELESLQMCGFRPSAEIVYDGAVMKCDWNNCLAFFDDIITYIEHINMHIDALGTENRNHRFQLQCLWRDCKMGFRNKANLRIHIRHHSGDKVTACPFCGAFFASNSKLFDHMLRRNPTAEDVMAADAVGENSCILCQKRFESQRLLREHCRRHVMNYKCFLKKRM